MKNVQIQLPLLPLDSAADAGGSRHSLQYLQHAVPGRCGDDCKRLWALLSPILIVGAVECAH